MEIRRNKTQMTHVQMHGKQARGIGRSAPDERATSQNHCRPQMSWNLRQTPGYTNNNKCKEVAPTWQEYHQNLRAHHQRAQSAVRSGKHEARDQKKATHSWSDSIVGGVDGWRPAESGRCRANSRTNWQHLLNRIESEMRRPMKTPDK